MTEDLVKRYYNVEQLDALLTELAIATAYMLCESTKRIANENWQNEELVENMIESDTQLMKRFCEILMQKDLEASQRAGDKTREMYGN